MLHSGPFTTKGRYRLLKNRTRAAVRSPFENNDTSEPNVTQYSYRTMAVFQDGGHHVSPLKEIISLQAVNESLTIPRVVDCRGQEILFVCGYLFLSQNELLRASEFSQCTGIAELYIVAGSGQSGNGRPRESCRVDSQSLEWHTEITILSKTKFLEKVQRYPPSHRRHLHSIGFGSVKYPP